MRLESSYKSRNNNGWLMWVLRGISFVLRDNCLKEAIMVSLGNAELIPLDASGEVATPGVEEATFTGCGEATSTGVGSLL